MSKKSFILYHDTYGPIKALNQKEKGDLLDAIFVYSMENKETELAPLVHLAFQFIKNYLDRDSERWEIRAGASRENGAKGGRPKDPELTTIKGEKVPLEEKDKHFIYLIHDFIEKEYKIGETRDLIKRRYSIKRPTNNLEIIDFARASSVDCQKLEKQIIKDYGYCRVSGDWFNYSEEDVKEILEIFTQKTQWVSKIPKLPKEPVNVNVNVNANVNGNVIKEKKGVKKYLIENSVIDYFNQVTGKHMKHLASSQTPIATILSLGFTVENCHSVIDLKYKEWCNNMDMQKYITIQTFFRQANFEKYLNQEVIKPPETKAKQRHVLETITEEEREEGNKLIEEAGGLGTLFKGKLKNIRAGVGNEF